MTAAQHQPIIYLCGPMTGMPDFNRAAFLQAEDRLRAAGYQMLVNPVRNGLGTEAPWINHMRADIANLVSTCDAVATLPGHETSRGARVETALASGLGWPVRTVDEWLFMAALAREGAAA